MKRTLFVLALLALLALAPSAYADTVTFTGLSGVTGGTPAQTGVYKADLSSIGFSIQSITIADGGSTIGGAAGQFSGFDLDAIKLSSTNCADAACAASAVGLSVFNFSSLGTIFSPGSQRVPVDPKLFGTDALGTHVDDSVARLGLFDGNSTTVTPDGFLSMGDGGVLTFNLTGPVSPAGMYLYIGEVGDNGEVAAGRISVSNTTVPEPASMLLLGSGLIGLTGAARRRMKK